MSLQKEEVFRAFQLLLTEYEKNKLRVATREEIAARSSDREAVKNASTYTTDAIVKGLTDLQLNFSDTIGKWTDTLQTESHKYEELKKAIEVETRRFRDLQDVKIAASAFYLLKEEHQGTIDLLDKDFREKTSLLDETIARTREAWEKEQKDFDQTAAEFLENLAKERHREQEDYAYTVERTRKIEEDEYEQRKRLLDREFTEEDARRARNWNERGETLDKQTAEFEANRKKLDEFQAKLDEEVKKERDEAAKEASREVRVKADLLEREEIANRQLGEHRIALLEKTIETNNTEIDQLTAQLNDALQKVQELSARALESGAQKL